MNRLILCSTLISLSMPAVAAYDAPASTSAVGAPVQQRKRDFSRELSTVIEDVDRAQVRLDAALRAGSQQVSQEQVAKIRSALEAAKAKWNALNAAAPEKF